MENYRLVMQYEDSQGQYINDEIIAAGTINSPKELIDLGLRHSEQILILQKIQDNILNAQSKYLKEDISHCPKCNNKLRMNGTNKCSFNGVFTDHKVRVHRKLCGFCKWSSVPSINSLFGGHMHPDLIKMQCEEVSKQSYSNAKESLNRQSYHKRAVNSTMTLHGVVEKVGNYISDNPTNDTVKVSEAKSLVVQVDGGHLKTKEKNSRSFEALTSVVYHPDHVNNITNNDRGEISKKHCAASALQDRQKQIKKLTLSAAKKEGMTKNTEIVAVCDGADNCWSVIDVLKNCCKSIICILDWFHIAMRFKNIGSLGTKISDKLLESCKWSLWHGNVPLFVKRIDSIISQISDQKALLKLNKLKKYIQENASKIINYNSRKNDNLIFTSNVAECNVESLINQRCKGKQHMQWSRNGVHALLQIRAASASNDWDSNWLKYVLGAYQK